MIKLISFDFDGTLADSVDFCLKVFDIVFQKYMKENAPSREEIYQCFGMNEEGVLLHFMGEEGKKGVEEFNFLHQKLHKEMCPDVFPSVRQFLDFLKKKGIILTILTGRSAATAGISLEFLKLKEYFSFVQTGTKETNDKSFQLKLLMEKYHLKEEELLYIGDAVSDVVSAQKANVRCLSAAWGKSARIPELEKINPGNVFPTVKSMQDFLEKELEK